MGWLIAGFLLLLLIASGPPADGASPTVTVPTETTVSLNPGGGHCGFGPNDDDVRAVIRAVPSTIPHC